MTVSGSFTIPVELPAAPAAVWPLLAELPRRRTWVRMPGPSATETHELDFRAGGSERLTNTFVSGELHQELENRSTIYDVVPEQRIVSSYQAIVDGRVQWVALATVELTPTPGGTHLDWTEQYVFLRLTTPGGVDDVKHLIGGTHLRLNGLIAAVAQLPSTQA